MKIAIIGYKNHALRLKDILTDLGYTDALTYNHKKDTEDSLQDSDVFFISSPNHTHVNWLFTLMQYDKYIYCEKPPATNLEDLRKLRDRINEKVYLNFNYRHSLFSKYVLKYITNQKYGRLLYMNFISTNGLAGKKSYQDNWRFLSENIFSSIIGNVGIHYVDLVGYMCGGIKDIKIEADAIISGKLPDTATIKVYSEICNSEIFISYAAPFKNQATAVFENAIIEFTDACISIQEPRDTFDITGRFAPPQKRHLHQEFNNTKSYYDNSLSESIKYFLDLVRSESVIPREGQIRSFESCEKLLAAI